MIKPGEEWGQPTDATAEVECRGDDQALAALITAESTDLAPGRLVRFFPSGSDLARAVGLADVRDDQPVRGIELPVDAISSDLGVAMNSVILGVLPTRLRSHHRRRPIRVSVDGRELFSGPATSVVIANGQFVAGVDLVPRGHPGDGRLEVQVYALTPGERGPMRRRLPTGSHVPHPRILATSGRVIEIGGLTRLWPVTLDRRRATAETRLDVSVLPGALRLLI
ncbi:MAG: hypothetical protein ABIP21_09825 [Acidimicrobiia bacterium]